MKRIFLVLFVLASGLIATAQTCDCEELSGSLATQELSNDECYTLSGCVTVGEDVTLTIEAGTKIYPEANSALLVQPGGTIIANGTSQNPIVFIPMMVADRNYGEWQGIAVGGLARNNVTGGVIELERTCPLGAGGNVDNDNSGSMTYVQIHCAVNGLSLLSVGSGTTINNIQVTHASENGFEFYGGTVNVNNLVSFNIKQSDFFATNGYIGDQQFLFGLRRDEAAHSSSGSYGYLSTNDASSSSNTPITRPVVSNFLTVGPDLCNSTTLNNNFRDGIRVMNNSAATFHNSVVWQWKNYGYFIDGAGSISKTGAMTGQLNFSNNSLAANILGDYDHSSTWSSACDAFMADWIDPSSPLSCSESGNIFDASITTIGYNASDMCNSTTNPDFTLGMTTLGTASFAHADVSSGFSSVSHRGAFGNTDWTNTWTQWNPLNVDYCEEDRMRSAADMNSLHLIPNPSSSQTTAVFETNTTGLARLTVLDKIDGRPVKTVKVTVERSGEQRIQLDVSGIRAGVYIVKVEIGEQVMHQQLMVK